VGKFPEVVRVTGLDHIVLNSTDVERSLAWYCDRLGLMPVRVDEWRSGQAPFPSLRINDHTIIDLLASDRSGVNVDHICLVVDTVDLRALAASESFDVIGDGPIDGLFGARGTATSLYVRDPDANTIELRCYDNDG
jgi:catechol 2,3-dioxygenase-like lactoylglutathione lyase family enzyme